MKERQREWTPGGRWLHNMSAPPRLRVVIRPLRQEGGKGTAAAGKLLTTIELGRARRDGLAFLLGLVAEIMGGPGPLDAELLEATAEFRVDRVIHTALSIETAELGLPRYAIAVPGTPGNGDTDGDPRIVLTLLTRLSGSLFVARRPPHLPDLRRLPETLAFHALTPRRPK